MGLCFGLGAGKDQDIAAGHAREPLQLDSSGTASGSPAAPTKRARKLTQQQSKLSIGAVAQPRCTSAGSLQGLRSRARRWQSAGLSQLRGAGADTVEEQGDAKSGTVRGPCPGR